MKFKLFCNTTEVPWVGGSDWEPTTLEEAERHVRERVAHMKPGILRSYSVEVLEPKRYSFVAKAAFLFEEVK